MEALVLGALLLAIASPAASPAGPPSQSIHPRPPSATTASLEGPTTIPPMSGWNMEVVDALETGSPQAVKIIGDIAYVGYGGILTVLDVSDPSAPQKLGFAFLDASCVNIERNGSYLYCITSAYPQYRLAIVDVSVPSNPLVIQTLSTQGQAMHVDGNRLYVEHGNGVRIFDVSDPSDPQLLGFFSSPNVSDIDARDGMAYVVTGISVAPALQIVNVTNPANPVQVVLFPMGGHPTAIALLGHYICAVTFSPSRFYIVDVANPSTPTIVSASAPGQYFFDVAIQGDHAFVGSNYGMLHIFDVADPNNPVALPPLQDLCDSYDMHLLDIEGDVAALGVGYSICFVDISTPNSVVELASHASLPNDDSIDVAGDRLAVSLTYGGLALVNRYELSIRSLVWVPNSYIDGTQVAVRGGHAYLAMNDSWYNYDDALAVIDISDPDNPMLDGQLDTPWFPTPLSAGANHVYLATQEGLWVVDVSGPVPTKVGELSMTIGGLFASEPLLYAKTQNELHLLDVSNASTPSVLGSLPMTGYADVWVEGPLAYVTSDPGLQIVDISNPLMPSLVGSISLPSSAYLRVKDQYAYVSAGSHLRIIDVSNPTTPAEVGNIETHGLWARVVVAPPYVYAVTDGPLLVLETPLITDIPHAPARTFALKQNYPNPFNPSTTIAFDTQSSGRVRLDIFDVRGKLVRRLVDESMPEGAHSITWDGRDATGVAAGSGVYFYRLEANGKSEAKRMVILK